MTRISSGSVASQISSIRISEKKIAQKRYATRALVCAPLHCNRSSGTGNLDANDAALILHGIAETTAIGNVMNRNADVVEGAVPTCRVW